MSFFTSFIHNEALAEILIEGHNPHALQKLQVADLDALAREMHSGQSLQAYVIGRIVGAGRGVWALTDQAVLVRNAAMQGVERFALADVSAFEAERGRYGHTVRLHIADRRLAMFGADRELAGMMHLALQARGIASQFEDKPARSHLWRTPAPQNWAQECLRDAQRHLQAA